MKNLDITSYKIIRQHKDSRRIVNIYQHKTNPSGFKAEIMSRDLTKNSHFWMGMEDNCIEEWTSNNDYKMPKWVQTYVDGVRSKIRKAHDESLYGKLVAQSEEFKEHNDCTVKAVAAAAEISYSEAHALLKRNGRTNRKGMYHHQYVSAVKNDLGREVVEMQWTDMCNLAKTIGCKTLTMNNVVKVLDKNKNYLVNMRGHVVGLVRGELADWSKGRKFQVVSIVEVKA